jgi:hypothetical protein
VTSSNSMKVPAETARRVHHLRSMILVQRLIDG